MSLNITFFVLFRLYYILLWFFIVNFVILMWIESQHLKSPFVEVGHFSSKQQLVIIFNSSDVNLAYYVKKILGYGHNPEYSEK